MSYPAILARFTPDPDKVIPTKEEIVFANIGCNRVISNSAEIKQPTFESVKLRRSGPLIIHEKRWYFRLVCNKQIEKKTSRALMDDYNLNDISRHMVVCFTPDKLPGQDKPFRTKDNEFIHLFAFFDCVDPNEGGTGRRATEQRSTANFCRLSTVDSTECEWRTCSF